MRIVRIKLRDIMQAQILQLEHDTDRLSDLYNKAGMERRIREYLSAGHAFGDTVIRQAGNVSQEVIQCVLEDSVIPQLCS